MTKINYPLDVESVGGDTYIVMSRGHHDLTAFMAKVNEDYSSWNMKNPKHVWCKTVPDRTGQLNSRYAFVEAGTRGAWPATYAWE